MKYKKKILRNIYQNMLGAMTGLKTIGVELDDKNIPHFDNKKNKIKTFSVVPYADNDLTVSLLTLARLMSTPSKRICQNF